MENENYQKLIDNLEDPEKVKEATSKKIDIQETIKNIKKYYHKISHDDYYAAKAKLDKNVELKKSIRERIRKLDLIKDKVALNDEEELEVRRVNKLLENQDKTPETERTITKKMNEIEEKLKELRILINNSFE